MYPIQGQTSRQWSSIWFVAPDDIIHSAFPSSGRAHLCFWNQVDPLDILGIHTRFLSGTHYRLSVANYCQVSLHSRLQHQWQTPQISTRGDHALQEAQNWLTKLTRKFCTLMKVTRPTACMRWPHALEIHTHQRLAITCSPVSMYSTFTHVYYANCGAICYAYVPMIVSACVRSSCTTAPALWYSFMV